MVSTKLAGSGCSAVRILVAALAGLALICTGLATTTPAWATAADSPGFAVFGGAGYPVDDGMMIAVAPTRMLDTRTTTSVGPDSTVSFQVGGVSGIPRSVSAVTFNLTVTNPRSFGFVSAFPSGTTRPDASNLNFDTGQTVANSVTVPVGADGKVILFNRSSGTTHLIADVSGYHLSGNPAGSVWMLGGRNGDSLPVQMQGLSEVVKLTGLYSHWYAVLADGTVRAWGNNESGQLGDGTGTDRSTPVQVVGLSNVKSVTAEEGAAYAVLEDGTARAWGDNLYGRLGDGTHMSRAVPVKVEGLSGVTSITTNGWQSDGFSAFALLDDGTVRAWGGNGFGQLGIGTTVNSYVPVPIPGLAGVTKVVSSGLSTYALLSNGTVWAWGGNADGQLGDGTNTYRQTPVQVEGLTDVKTLTPHGVSVYAVHTDGTVSAWGANDSGRLGLGTTTDSNVPLRIPGLDGVQTVVADSVTIYALLTDGTVRAWGDGAVGKLGNGTTTTSLAPVQVSGLHDVRSLAAAHSAAFALMGDGTVRAWGSNRYGLLGNGLIIDSPYPVRVPGLIGIRGFQE